MFKLKRIFQLILGWWYLIVNAGSMQFMGLIPGIFNSVNTMTCSFYQKCISAFNILYAALDQSIS